MHTRSLQLSSLVFLGALSVLWGESALAQDLTPRAKPQDKPVLITNATIHPIAEKPIENGFVLFAEGKVRGLGSVGAMDMSRVQGADGWRIIDAKGMHVYPGLIGAATQLGLEEMQSIRSSTDHTETGGVTPEVRAATAINPDSTLLPVTRSAGELLAAVFPRGGAILGRTSVVRLDGWTVADMTIREDAGLVINWPMTRIITAWWMNKSEEEQRKENDKALRVIEDMVTGAKAYAAASVAGEQRAADIRYEAMTGIFGHRQEAKGAQAGPDADRRLPVFIHAMDYDQIQQAVTFCVKHGLRCVIVGGRDAPMCADLLKRHNVAVIVAGTYKFPKRDDSAYDEAFTLPARLEAAGIKWCLACGDDTAHERNLAPAAGLAVAYGLDHEAGLRSITLAAAEILGIADTYGALALDKSATLIIADGDILDARTNVTAAFLDGREINLHDKHKALDERYREKYKLKSGPAAGHP